MLGVPQGKVRLLDYQDDWPEAFARERRRLEEALGDPVVAIEHVGSTAVLGMRAKPLIDVMIGLRRLEDHEACIPLMEALGYEYKGEFGIPGRHFFVLGDPTTHHVHMVEHGLHFWRLNLHFRDMLRRDPAARDRYVAEKIRLAEEHADCREKYTAGKNDIIQTLLHESGWIEDE
jgi:GrpB-like predicted nucleotidyltransferase (UPF0157 family)